MSPAGLLGHHGAWNLTGDGATVAVGTAREALPVSTGTCWNSAFCYGVRSVRNPGVGPGVSGRGKRRGRSRPERPGTGPFL